MKKFDGALPGSVGFFRVLNASLAGEFGRTKGLMECPQPVEKRKHPAL
jgi:hypothetical protein